MKLHSTGRAGFEMGVGDVLLLLLMLWTLDPQSFLEVDSAV